MDIRSIHLRNFMRHKDTEVTFPEKGIVIVTGPNGHGKSALIEAVPAAIWNETLRGTPWNLADSASSVGVKFGHKGADLAVMRTYNKSGVHKFKATADSREYDSATKAQEVLNSTIGSFEVWRRTHVFSTSDDAHLTRSTDGERKRFMEAILGIDKFDIGLKSCREDLKGWNSKLQTLSSEYQLNDTKQSYEHKRLEEAQKNLKACEVPEKPSKPDVSALNALETDLRGAESKLRALDRDMSNKRARLDLAEKEEARLASGSCPTCAQVIDPKTKHRHTQAILEATKELVSVRATNEESIAHLEAEIEELKEDIAAMRQKNTSYDGDLRRYNTAKQEKERHEKTVEEAAKANASFLRKRAEARQAMADAEVEVATLEVCEKILGLRGLRANITANALGGLAEIANQWLAKFTAPDEPTLKLDIKPYKELKRGGVSDEWSIDIDGAGGGFGYKAASTGQRQRIDVALLFASFSIAQAAAGDSGGTIFCDEIFDGLDSVGISAVSEVLGLLATDRTVVVVSHSETVMEALPAVMRLEVLDGEVTIS